MFCLEPILNGIPPSRHHSIRKKYNFAGSLLTLYLECGSAPRRGLRRIEKAAALLLLAKGANRGFTRSICPGAHHKGISIMKIIVIVAAGLVAMLSVAGAADLPRKEPPPVAAAPIGKYPVGKYPVGKYPVGKYPQPVVTKG